MYPVLFKIPLFGGITVYSYGVMVALGFVAAILWVTFESRRLGQNPSKAMDLIFAVIVAGIVGSRILHVAIAERGRFSSDPLMIFRIWEGGLVFYGGLIAALFVAVWFIRRNRMPLLLTMDIFAPAIAIGHAIGRIGCFLAGCCYGRVVDHPAWYSVVFPAGTKSFAPTGVPLYPTQLMESAGEFTIFLVLVFLSRFKRFNGQIITTYLMLYAVLRGVNEIFRGDSERGFLIPDLLSTSQFISIIMFAAGAAIYVWNWRKFSGGGRHGT
ncbi:MAG TPA: prolipoprotein diacylglyceryl transferase [bacterium]|nr:prolipoprotein diacylglyceryl transferase [bacterium]